MRLTPALCAAALVTLCSAPASAATQLLDITVVGTLGAALPCTPSEAAQNTCQDANLATGDTITLTAVISASTLVSNGDGTKTALVYSLATQKNTTIPEYFQITGPGGLIWGAQNVNDNPLKTWITIEGNQVVGLYGDILNGPELLMGGAGMSALTPSDPTFYLEQPNCMYDDCYSTPGFIGTWDFANSTITDGGVIADAAPEPSAWAMMLVGFAMIGFALRRRQVPLVFTL